MDKNTVGYVEYKKDLTPKESHKLEIYNGCEKDYELDKDDLKTYKMEMEEYNG